MAKDVKFTFYQLLAAQRYVSKRDLLWALLRPTESYTIAEVDAKIDDFLKSEVK